MKERLMKKFEELQADSLPSCIPACWSDRQEWQ